MLPSSKNYETKDNKNNAIVTQQLFLVKCKNSVHLLLYIRFSSHHFILCLPKFSSQNKIHSLRPEYVHVFVSTTNNTFYLHTTTLNMLEFDLQLSLQDNDVCNSKLGKSSKNHFYCQHSEKHELAVTTKQPYESVIRRFLKISRELQATNLLFKNGQPKMLMLSCDAYSRVTRLEKMIEKTNRIRFLTIFLFKKLPVKRY